MSTTSGNRAASVSPGRKNAATVRRLVLLVVGMFAFGWALIPLYDLLCEITGLGGNTGGQYTYDPASERVDRSRLVKVNFVVNTNDGMPWQFWADKNGMRVHPGELNEATFYVKNTTDRAMVGQAVPSVVPLTATDYFHKTECFCFQSQVLAPGEEMEMPMRFFVDADLPQNVQSISLSYALFDITELAGNRELLKSASTHELGGG
ncbi:MAG: cytochrome c oxidase assembly protein [Pseudomonadales bacterium]